MCCHSIDEIRIMAIEVTNMYLAVDKLNDGISI